MAGGMTSRQGPTLAERALRPEPESRASNVRHCWVQNAPGHPGRYPGLVIEWRRSAEWEAFVAYLMAEQDGRHRLVQRWLPAGCLRPAA